MGIIARSSPSERHTPGLPSAMDVANYIIAFSDCKGDLITNKKLQKLIYYVQAWSLAIFKDKIFDENPQAWVHGPVYPSVYYNFREFGYEAVSIKSKYEEKGLSCDEFIESYKGGLLSDNLLNLIEEVILKYGGLSAFKLELLSHREKPWLEKREGLGEFDNSSNEISFETMEIYYSTLLAK